MNTYDKMILTLKSLYDIHISENRRLFAQLVEYEQIVDTPSLAVRKLKNFVILEEQKSDSIKQSIDRLEESSSEHKNSDILDKDEMSLIKQTSKKLQLALLQYNDELRMYKTLLNKYINSQN